MIYPERSGGCTSVFWKSSERKTMSSLPLPDKDSITANSEAQAVEIENKFAHNYEAFAFSVKILRHKKKIIDEKSYEPFFKLLYKVGRRIYKIAETDSKNLLHYHGVVYLPIGFYMKKLCIWNFHIKFKCIWNMNRWNMYMYKNYNYDHYDHHIDLTCKEKLRK